MPTRFGQRRPRHRRSSAGPGLQQMGEDEMSVRRDAGSGNPAEQPADLQAAGVRHPRNGDEFPSPGLGPDEIGDIAKLQARLEIAHEDPRHDGICVRDEVIKQLEDWIEFREAELDARVSELLAANNAEVEKRRKAERWAAFGRAVMAQHKDNDCGDVDGGSLQELGVQTGVLEIVEAKGPCAEEGCMCAATCDDWPVDCYRVVTP